MVYSYNASQKWGICVGSEWEGLDRGCESLGGRGGGSVVIICIMKHYHDIFMIGLSNVVNDMFIMYLLDFKWKWYSNVTFKSLNIIFIGWTIYSDLFSLISLFFLSQ